MHDNAELLTRFYTAFAARDAEGMAACYAEDVRFSDPVFPDLRGPQATGMWRMLCRRGKDLEIVFSDIEADDTSGRAHWDATYTFATTGREVHNRVDATFTFRDGLIVEHTDAFDLYAWTRMAFGPVGTLIGWLPPFQGFLRRKVGQELEKFLARHPEKAAQAS